MNKILSFKATPLGYYLGHFIPISTFILYAINPNLTYLTIFLAFGLIPILDQIVGKDHTNFDSETQKRIEKSLPYKICPIVGLPLLIYLLVWASQEAAMHGVDSGAFWGLVFSLGISSTILGGAAGHELIHRTNKLENFCGQLYLSSFFYGHFSIEHIIGHHVRVSTPDDPTSSRYGETLYQFLPRTIIGSYMSVFNFEKKRLARKNLPWYSFKNRLWAYLILPLSFAFILFESFGEAALIFYMAQSFVAIILVEMVNYIEHYGLQREKMPNGKYEKVTPFHSWNADYVMSNYFLFSLPRHSDHHAHATIRYQNLRSFPKAPQMPHGYPSMYLVALFPPIWFKVMNPLVKEYNQKLEEWKQAEKQDISELSPQY